MAVLNLLRSVVLAALAFLRTRRQLAVEILALHHQLGVLKRSVKRPRLTNVDRGLWVLLSRRWAGWSDALIIVKPATVIKWHRAGLPFLLQPVKTPGEGNCVLNGYVGAGNHHALDQQTYQPLAALEVQLV